MTTTDPLLAEIKEASAAGGWFGEPWTAGSGDGSAPMPPGRKISGATLRTLLVRDPPPALRLRGLEITGPVDLAGIRFEGELALDGCRIDGGDIDLSGAQLGGLQLTETAVEGSLLTSSLEIDRSVVLDGLRVSSVLDARHANIGGRLSLIGAQFSDESGDRGRTVLDLSGARVGAQLLASGINAWGQVLLHGVRVEGEADFIDAEFMGSPNSLALDNARFGGAVLIKSAESYGRLRAEGRLSMDGARIEGQLNFSGANLAGLEARNIRVGGDLFLNHGTVKGAVIMTAASVAGQFNASGEQLDGGGERALDAEGLRIGTDLWLDNRCRAKGSVVLRNLVAGGQLNAIGSTFDGDGEVALDLERARIGTELSLGDAEWTEEGGFTATGKVVLTAATIGGGLRAAGGHFNGCGGDDALSAERLSVGTDIVLAAVPGPGARRGYRFEAVGAVALRAASAGGSVDCHGGRFEGRDPGQTVDPTVVTAAIDAAFLKVGDTLDLTELELSGGLSLRGARVGRLADDARYWTDFHDSARRNRLDFDGCVYRELDRPAPDLSWDRTGEWLASMRPYRAQPWLQLASVLQATGQERYARKVNIERHKQRLRAESDRSADNPDRSSTWSARLLDHLLGVTIGFGYAPWRAVLWAIALVAIGWAVYTPARAHDLLVPTRAAHVKGAPVVRSSRCTAAYPCVHSLIYSIDTVLPVVRLGERDNWSIDTRTPSGTLVALFTWTATVMGWVLATFVVASFTNVVRRE